MVQGTNIDVTVSSLCALVAISDLQSGSSQPSTAIDTGTTLIAAPEAAIEAIYAAIPNSQPMSGSGNQGLWSFPCDTNLNVSMQYGGLSYQISTADMNLGRFSSSSDMCTGAFFQMDMSSQSPISWIVGASFLKNVYSVFRYEPTAIGFAALSGQSDSVSNGTNTPTTGGGTIGGGGSSGSSSGNGAGRSAAGLAGLALAVVGSVAAVLI